MKPLPYKQRMSLTDEALAGLPKHTNDLAKFQGQYGYWVQGEAVFIPCSNAGTAISFYRQRFNAGDIAASHNLATAAVGRMRAAQVLEQFKEQTRQALLTLSAELSYAREWSAAAMVDEALESLLPAHPAAAASGVTGEAGV